MITINIFYNHLPHLKNFVGTEEETSTSELAANEVPFSSHRHRHNHHQRESQSVLKDVREESIQQHSSSPESPHLHNTRPESPHKCVASSRKSPTKQVVLTDAENGNSPQVSGEDTTGTSSRGKVRSQTPNLASANIYQQGIHRITVVCMYIYVSTINIFAFFRVSAAKILVHPPVGVHFLMQLVPSWLELLFLSFVLARKHSIGPCEL